MTDSVFNHGDQYDSYARHCLSVAARTPDRDSRLILREMAAEWLKLAASVLDGRHPGHGRPADGALAND